MAATLTAGKATVAGTISGNAPQERAYPEAASLQNKIGEFVYLAAGLATEIGDNPALILGMATGDGQNTTASLNDLPVALANGDTIYSANKTDSSGAVAATAASDVGSDLGLKRDTSGNITTVYINAGANARAMCIGLDPRDKLGDIGGRLLFVIKGGFRQLFCTS